MHKLNFGKIVWWLMWVVALLLWLNILPPLPASTRRFLYDVDVGVPYSMFVLYMTALFTIAYGLTR